MARKQFGTVAAAGADLTTRNDVLATASADGCCRMSVASTTSLKLSPLNGNTLWVGGQACTIPSAGVSQSFTGLAASTLYYIYAQASGGAVNALAISTTGHITGADGREYLSSGGSTPTATTNSRLVGMVLTNGSAQFADTATFRGCLNWFNRRALRATSAVTGQTSSTSSYANVGNLLYFLTWADEDVAIRLSGSASNNTASASAVSYNILDNNASGQSQMNSSGANVQQAVNAEGGGSLAEGAHNVYPAGLVSSGAATWAGQQNVYFRG